MVFKCQEDSFLKEYTAKVLKCEETNESIVEYGKVSQFEGYQITLENTILFPAGGGQPHDIGWLNDIEVLQVLRKGDEAVHFTQKPIEVGTEVVQKINWERRFDHMQQHSGQHLLSAILEKDHNLPTTSWWLGSVTCHIELNCTNIKEDVLSCVEKKCNDLIQLAIPVNVKLCKADDPDLDEAHTRGLPKDCTDTIRVICIGDIDENMCCGTHVTNLCQLQMIKLLCVESGKKGKINLGFVVGNRVTKTFQLMLDREKALTALLKNEPKEHEELVSKLLKSWKTSYKNLQNVVLELSQYEIDKIKNTDPKPKYIILHKMIATPEMNRAICKGLEGENLFIFLISNDLTNSPGKYQIIAQGPHCEELVPQITEIFKSVGAFKNGKYQGKTQDVTGLKKWKNFVKSYFNKP